MKGIMPIRTKPGATAKIMSHRTKGCVADCASDFVIL